MLHLVSHLAVPLLIVAVLYRSRWRQAALIVTGTMLVDVDHVFAVPIYDPDRCSINFHPLHTTTAIALYLVLLALPLIAGRKTKDSGPQPFVRISHLIGLGLVIHVALDWADCML